MERMIVTGGAGFIGANFVRAALEQTEAEVVVFDKLTYAGRRENLAELEAEARFRFVLGDVADRAAVRRLFAEVRPTQVVNFAAESHVDRSIDAPDDFVRTNVHGTFELLEAARALYAELPPAARSGFRFLHVSTDEVYGSLGPAEAPFTETTPYDPSSPYSATKAAADHLVQAYGRTYGLPVLITNCSNNYGPFQFPEKLIPLMILNAAEGRDLPVYGDGGNVRDWIYVADHCHGVLRALAAGRPGEKYNLGGRAERTNLEVVEAICDLVEERLPAAGNEALRRRGAKSYRQLITFVDDRPGHDWRYAIDCRKAEEELGWTPRHDFAGGLRRTVAWYLDNLDWCRAVHPRQRQGLAGVER
ncbi:MAG: dTDP-glucose 4,6-dehydratase [Acidobacteria bacterium]|nr:MAG: dTDP-glucose 4,6-dehydratase [Acidobacteriota bacterium]